MSEKELNKLLKSWYTNEVIWKVIKPYLKSVVYKGVK